MHQIIALGNEIKVKMANFFKAPVKKKQTGQQLTVKINRLDLNGCGVASLDNKPAFIPGALPGEIVEIKVLEQKNKYMKAKLLQVKKQSPTRADVQCEHFSVCGGCDIQHLLPEEQLIFKQHKVTELFSRQGMVEVLPWQAALTGNSWSYRRKARIGVQFDKKYNPTVGFRQKSTNQLVAIKQCPVLVEPLAGLFTPLKALIAQLTVKGAIGHIEAIHADITVGEHYQGKKHIALIVRQLKPINSFDIQLWQQFSNQWGCIVLLDDGKHCTDIFSVAEPQSCQPQLSYALDDELTILFNSDDFIQVNHGVNLSMVSQAIDWLAVNSEDKVLDLFCGLGNFSLAMAKIAKHVVGVEGVQPMVDKAANNAKQNHLSNCRFYQADLNSHWQKQSWYQQEVNSNFEHGFNKALLDPARAGAEQAVEQIVKLKIPTLLYVSCDPVTLARDSKILLSCGYKIRKISLIDMFSQTKHVETMVLFQREE